MIPVLAAHGLGLGPWLFEPWRAAFAAAGLELRPLTLPGHGDGANAGFGDVVAAIEAALDAAGPTAILLGHSFSGLAVQTIVARRTLPAAVLVCPMPPGQLRLPVPAAVLRHLPRAAASLALGRPYLPGRVAWQRFGFGRLTPAQLDDVLARVSPWPNRLCRDLLRPPEVHPVAVDTPMLVALGGADPLVPSDVGRVIGDLFEAVVWRYDDLGHTPMLEPGGERLRDDVIRFCLDPVRPRVLESEGFAPEEGAGHQARRARRGAAAKRRSAYGQRGGAR